MDNRIHFNRATSPQSGRLITAGSAKYPDIYSMRVVDRCEAGEWFLIVPSETLIPITDSMFDIEARHKGYVPREEAMTD